MVRPERVEEHDRKRSWLDRALSFSTEVRAGEGLSALLLTINIFLILTAYYIIKPVRDALILALRVWRRIQSLYGRGDRGCARAGHQRVFAFGRPAAEVSALSPG